MKILIIENTASTGWNLKKGLSKLEGVERVDLVFEPHPTLSGVSSKKLLNPKDYDIVHYNYPFLFKHHFLNYHKYIKNAKVLVCHWRGTDLRGKDFKFPLNIFYKIIHKLTKKYFFKKADFHFYSTYDLAWWLRKIPEDRKSHVFSLIDTEIFKDYNLKNRKGTICLKKGARGFGKQKIKHDDMPNTLNKYKYAEVIPAEGLDPHLLSVSAMECLACGLKVKHHPDKDRNWIIENTSIPVVSKKVHNIYQDLIKKKNVKNN